MARIQSSFNFLRSATDGITLDHNWRLCRDCIPDHPQNKLSTRHQAKRARWGILQVLNVSGCACSNMRSVNVMESSGIVSTIVMNPRVTRRLQGESGIMQE